MWKDKPLKKNPLTRAQKFLLKDTLKRLLGSGLIKEAERHPSQVKSMVLKDALNAIVLSED